MSRAILDAPMTFPALSFTGDTVNEMLISMPSFRRRIVS
jgi:hypothetical protein